MREVVRSIVSEIAPLDSEEADHRVDVIQWIDAGFDIFRTVKPATPPKHLVSSCVLVDTDSRMILLVDHRDAQRWLPSGGHVEPGEHPADAASREIHEELGVSPSFLPTVGDAPLMATVTETAGVSASHTDVSLWFAFDGSTDTPLLPDAAESADTRWWSFDDVIHGPRTRFAPHLPRFVEKLTSSTA